ncbi:MAG: hypothetical protein JSW60_09655, partial [Thermoplasmatales archaeon]
TTYYWKVVAWDNHNASTEGPIWNFTTRGNSPPYIPSYPFPEDGAIDVDVDADLSWTGSDPDPGDTVTFDVYFGATSPPPQVAWNISDTYDPGTMNYGTTYYWKVVAWDNHGASTVGPIWGFTTEFSLPPEVEITKPMKKSFYLRNIRLFPCPFGTIIYGPIDIEVNVTSAAGIERVEFYINDKLVENDSEEPYSFRWAPILSGRYTLKVLAYDNIGNQAQDEISVLKWRIHPALIIVGFLLLARFGI